MGGVRRCADGVAPRLPKALQVVVGLLLRVPDQIGVEIHAKGSA